MVQFDSTVRSTETESTKSDDAIEFYVAVQRAIRFSEIDLVLDMPVLDGSSYFVRCKALKCLERQLKYRQ